MPLQKQNIPISFVQGIETKSDRKQVLPGRLLRLENGRFTSIGQIIKRDGYGALGSAIETGGSISMGAGLATFQRELLEFDGTSLYSYSLSNNLWTSKGQVTSLELTLAPVIRNNYAQSTPDMAQHPSGLQVFAWEDSRGGSRYSVVDSITGQALVQDALIASTAVKPRCLALGAYLIVFFIRTSDHHLRFFAIPVATPATPTAQVDFATDVDTVHFNYDACVLSTRIFVAYNDSSGGGGISVRYLNSFLSASAAISEASENADVAINIFPDTVNQQLWIAYYNGTDIKYFIKAYSVPVANILNPTVIDTVADVVRLAGIASAGGGLVWWEITAAATYNHYVSLATVTSAGAVGGPTVFLRSVGIGGKPFSYVDNWYIVLIHESLLQPTYFVARTDGSVVAKIVPNNAGGLLSKDIIPETVQVTDGIVSLAILQKDILTTISGQIYTNSGVVQAKMDFTSNATFLKAELSQNLHINGGILEMYDGVTVVEHGFNVFPEDITATPSNVGGNITAGQYQYRVTYEWTDNQGLLHRSAPSVPVTVTFAGGVTTGQVDLTIPTLRITSKTQVRVVVYRTEGNGTIFYQLTSITSPLLNTTAADTVSYNDKAANSTIIGNPLLYTTGGVVENIAVPAPKLITTYGNRLIVVPSEDANNFWYSKEIVPGAPVEFSDFLVQNIDQRGGDITSVVQLDSNLILFKETRIFVQSGNGPTSTGSQNDFQNAQLVTSDGGCTNPRSVVLVPDGVMYKSLKGIYLLNRSLSVSYIGAEVEAFNSSVITSANLIPNTTQVRFSLDTGEVLVYDYYVKQWGIDTNYSAVDAVIFEDLYTHVTTAGIVMQETPSLYTDNGRFIKLLLQTSWLSMAGLQGFQRAYRALFLGEYKSPHQLLISVAYDFDPAFLQQDLINLTTVYPITNYGDDTPYGSEEVYGGQYPQYQFRIDFAKQKCQSILFQMEDIQSSNFGEGLALSGFNLMVGAKVGSNKVPATRTFG
jgi:hypothetical protein